MDEELRKVDVKAETTLLRTYHVHVDSVRVRPGVLEVLLQALAERVRNLVEPDELFDLLHLRVVARRARVQTLNDGAHVAEDARVHQSCGTHIAIQIFTARHSYASAVLGVVILSVRLSVTRVLCG